MPVRKYVPRFEAVQWRGGNWEDLRLFGIQVYGLSDSDDYQDNLTIFDHHLELVECWVGDYIVKKGERIIVIQKNIFELRYIELED